MCAEKCPYCSGELEKGKLISRGGNFFLPDGEKMPSLFTEKSMNKSRAILLPPDIVSDGDVQFPMAYVCRVCKKIISPHSESMKKESVDILKKNGFLYGILIISIAGGHFV